MDRRTCLIFKGYKDRDGYGIMSNGERAHRVSYSNAFGPFDERLHVCHKCDNPPCINPNHLFLGTNADNMRDKVLKGRHVPVRLFGETNPQAKLNAENISEIRFIYSFGGTSQWTIAKAYGVSQAVISKIVGGKAWPLSVL